MRMFKLLMVAVISIPLFGQDSTPPDLTGFYMFPDTVRLLSGPDTLTVSIHAEEDDSGLNFVRFFLESPSGEKVVPGYGAFEPGSLDDSCSVEVALPSFSEFGDWRVTLLLLQDVAGNSMRYNQTAIRLAGFPSTVHVMSRQDVSAPRLLDLSISPDTVHVSGAPDTVTVTVQAEDTLSGLVSARMIFLSPSRGHRLAHLAVFRQASSRDTAEASFVIPLFAESGEWVLDELSLFDVLGNAVFLGPYDLAGMGFPVSFHVESSQEDAAAPVLASFFISPGPVEAGASTDSVSILIEATDEISGLSDFMVLLKSPSGGNAAAAIGRFTPGSLADTVMAAISADELTEMGEWRVSSLMISDVSGNRIMLTTDSLVSLGFSVSVSVTEAVSGVGVETGVKTFRLHQNHPNPFNPGTTLSFSLAGGEDAELSIYNVLGRKVCSFDVTHLPAGRHSVAWDGRDHAGRRMGSGIYYCRLSAGSFVQMRRMVLLK